MTTPRPSDRRDDTSPPAPDPRSGYWRALEELAPAFAVKDAGREFPPGHADAPEGPSRREFVRLLGASMALAGLGGCAQPAERILPYVESPPESTPGRSLRYATSITVAGHATGLLVESRDGRPIKVEGNPEHPASLGATDALAQASLLQLYDPHRAKRPRRGEEAIEPASVAAELARIRERAAAARGEGVAILTEPTGSPLEVALLDRVAERFPALTVYYHDPQVGAGPAAGARTALGRDASPVLEFDRADVVVALDADFLSGAPFPVRYAHDFAARRRVRSPDGSMNRLYVAEPAPTPTGGMADLRVPLRGSEIHAVSAALLARVAERMGGGAAVEALRGLDGSARSLGPAARDWVERAARDLAGAPGRAVVVVGDRQPAPVHAMGWLLNTVIGAVGETVRAVAPTITGGDAEVHGLVGLARALDDGAVESLIVLGGNPSYTAPADLRFGDRLRQVPTSLYLGLYHNETARDCDWSVPAAHYLESWGDGRAYDGTVSLIQPLIAPLYGGLTTAELLSRLLRPDGSTAHSLVRELWQDRLGGRDAWEAALRRGVVPGTEAPSLAVQPRWEALSESVRDRGAPALGDVEVGGGERERIEVVFARDASVLDGRFANNPWLQELPDPVTKLTWDNAALVSPGTARGLGVETGSVLRLRSGGEEILAPALVLPGHADQALTLPLGYGRSGGEEVAEGVGFDAYRLRRSGSEWLLGDVEVEPVAGERHALATTQRHWEMEGRPIVLDATLAAYRERPQFTDQHRGPQLSLYRPFEAEQSEGNQWAMAIDLAACTGCSACVVACQAENNIPVVGKQGVLESREMHWLRIDRYYKGDPENPEVRSQPMLCQHCEQAPCEYVCPVNATVHSPDGLNEMIYNRCVGTRFCSNNCPYKVRRFNWFDYAGRMAETEEMAMNPDVTVRARGVIEKCTFCVQRIRRSEIDARNQGRELRPGEVTTACEQACPTRAIAFGSLTDPDPELRQRLEAPRRYNVLHELGTEPRVSYLAHLSNPPPPAGDG